jgi:hypothetical protein
VCLDKWSTLVPSRDIGVSFSIVCDRGFAVGLCTHRHAAMGPLVWMAEPFFEECPTVDDVIATFFGLLGLFEIGRGIVQVL